MKGQIAQAFEERLAPLTKRIEKLEQRHAIEGVANIAWQCAEEDDILRQLDDLEALAMQAGSRFSHTVKKKLQGLATRMMFLPSIPRIEVIKLAQNILAQNPVILVTDDTLNEEQQRPELTRIFLMEPTEKTSRFDYQLPSSLYDNKKSWAMEEATTAIDKANAQLTSLDKTWDNLQKVLHGRYVVAFDLPLLQLQLAITARRHGLPIPMLVGHSLLDLLLKYTQVKRPIDYTWDEGNHTFSDMQLGAALAKEDVAPFADSSAAPADQRAHHMLHALQTIANGTLSLQEPLPVSSLIELIDPSSGMDPLLQ